MPSYRKQMQGVHQPQECDVVELLLDMLPCEYKHDSYRGTAECKQLEVCACRAKRGGECVIGLEIYHS